MTIESQTQANKARAAQVYAAINAQDMATLETLFTPNIIRHAMGEIGMEKAKQATLAAFADHPQRRFELQEMVAEQDQVALRVLVYDEVVSAEPQAVILELFRFENGRVAEIWGAGGAIRPLT